MQLGIRSTVTFKHQQNSKKLPENKENLLNRDFKASNIFQKLVADIWVILEESRTFCAYFIDSGPNKRHKCFPVLLEKSFCIITMYIFINKV